MSSPNISRLIGDLVSAGKAYENHEAGARERLIDLSSSLTGALEIPSEFVQRSFWAQVRALLSKVRVKIAPLTLVSPA